MVVTVVRVLLYSDQGIKQGKKIRERGKRKEKGHHSNGDWLPKDLNVLSRQAARRCLPL
jgi:hypothetical protein